MTLNGVVALILRYVTEFVYNVVLKQLLGLYLGFVLYFLILSDHINTICAIIQRVFGQKRGGNSLDVSSYAHVS